MSSLRARVANATSRSPSPSPSPKPEGDKYRLLVTVGPSYSTATHKVVHVNTDAPTFIENEFIRAKLKVRIRGFRGLPSSCPSSSPYFDDPAHERDQYSISFSFVPKQDLPSKDMIWGNDFDHPVRDRLPPGFNTAFRIVKEFIDPGLECDAYADEPYLIGPALSCWFALRIGEIMNEGEEIPEAEESRDVLREGADGSGVEVRQKHGIPDNNEKRRKFFLSAARREDFTFEKDRLYQVDFYNPYLDFGNFALKLPGFSIKVIKYIDEKSHTLRYVFKNRTTEDVYFSVNLNLLWGQQLRKVLGDDKEALHALAGAEVDADLLGAGESSASGEEWQDAEERPDSEQESDGSREKMKGMNLNDTRPIANGHPESKADNSDDMD